MVKRSILDTLNFNRVSLQEILKIEHFWKDIKVRKPPNGIPVYKIVFIGPPGAGESSPQLFVMKREINLYKSIENCNQCSCSGRKLLYGQ